MFGCLQNFLANMVKRTLILSLLIIEIKISFLGEKFEQFCEQMINGVINTVFWGETLSNPITIN